MTVTAYAYDQSKEASATRVPSVWSAIVVGQDWVIGGGVRGRVVGDDEVRRGDGSAMRMSARRLAGWVIGGLLGLLVLGFGGAYWYVAHPAETNRSLPEGTVALRSEQGGQLAEASRFRADLEPLRGEFAPQIYRSYCGVATGATVLRAFGRDVEQASFFEAESGPISGWNVFFSGLTLRELADVLEARGLAVEVRYASEVSLETFRREARANLAGEGDFLIVNYLRTAAGQKGGGHISPVAAYHADSDRFLVLDTAVYKYPPFWISAEQLYEAMATTDSASGRSRGYVSVSK